MPHLARASALATLTLSLITVHACACALAAQTSTPVPNQEPQHEPPPYNQFLVVPLRIHVLASSTLPEAHCTLSDEDLARILGKMNRIWHQAGIHFGVESVIREEAAGVERFTKTRDESRGPVPLAAFRTLAPAQSRDRQLLNVYYIHQFSVNGVYLGDGTAFVQDTAQLRPVPGGIDEPIPRVTAHELGHALGLPHRQARTNLLASGTTGTSLIESEIHKARETAVARWNALRTSDLARRAQSNPDTARALWGWLAEIPGEDAIKHKATEELQRTAQSQPKESPTNLLERNPTHDAHP